MYSKYEWICAQDGVEIRRVIEDPVLGTDIKKKETSYKELQSIMDKVKPIIISIEPVKEDNMLKALKLEVLLKIEDNRKPMVTERNFVEYDKRVSTLKIEKAIIKAIGNLGGRATRDKVHERVRKMIKEFESPYYQEIEPTGNIRWRHRIDTVKANLVSKGYIKKFNESGRGIWELTEEGWEYYKLL